MHLYPAWLLVVFNSLNVPCGAENPQYSRQYFIPAVLKAKCNQGGAASRKKEEKFADTKKNDTMVSNYVIIIKLQSPVFHS